MTDDGPVPATTAAPGASVAPQASHASPVWRVLVALGKIAAILAVLASIAFVWLWYTLQNAFEAPEGVSAPVAWVSGDVRLSPDQSIVHGRLTLTATSVRSSDFRVGVNAGVPSHEAAGPSRSAAPSSSPAPGAILLGPLTRLTATTSGSSARSCLAPCELQLPSSIECSSGSCRAEIDIAIELVGDGGLGGVVSVDISGGGTARLEQRLPDGFRVELVIDGVPVPAAT